MTREITEQAGNEDFITIIGEFGAGKSWLATRIHHLSSRKSHPLHTVDCSTLKKGEASELLFGEPPGRRHDRSRPSGLLHKSAEGTLLLKNFDHFPEELLDQLVESIERGPGARNPSDTGESSGLCTIVTLDIDAFYHSVARYTNRLSLFYSNHWILYQPPLRHRRDEIPGLIERFLNGEFQTRYTSGATVLTSKALYLCISYDWPGNLIQLKNAIEHACILAGDGPIQPHHLPASVIKGQPGEHERELLENDEGFVTAEQQLLSALVSVEHTIQELTELTGLTASDLDQKLTRYKLTSHLSRN